MAMKVKFTKAQKLAMKTAKDVMRCAWKMAKRASIKFGGKASDFFLESLKIVWRMFGSQQMDMFA